MENWISRPHVCINPKESILKAAMKIYIKIHKSVIFLNSPGQIWPDRMNVTHILKAKIYYTGCILQKKASRERMNLWHDNIEYLIYCYAKMWRKK